MHTFFFNIRYLIFFLHLKIVILTLWITELYIFTCVHKYTYIIFLKINLLNGICFGFSLKRKKVSLFKLPYCGIIRICGGSILNSIILWVPFNRGLRKVNLQNLKVAIIFHCFFYFLKNVEVSVNIQIKTMVQKYYQK